MYLAVVIKEDGINGEGRGRETRASQWNAICSARVIQQYLIIDNILRMSSFRRTTQKGQFVFMRLFCTRLLALFCCEHFRSLNGLKCYCWHFDEIPPRTNVMRTVYYYFYTKYLNAHWLQWESFAFNHKPIWTKCTWSLYCICYVIYCGTKRRQENREVYLLWYCALLLVDVFVFLLAHDRVSSFDPCRSRRKNPTANLLEFLCVTSGIRSEFDLLLFRSLSAFLSA